MDISREEILYLLATPFFVVVILLDIILSHIYNKKYYSTKGVLYNLYLELLNLGLDILMLGVSIYVLSFFFSYHFFAIKNIYIYWFVLLLAQDFMFYVMHYFDHHIRLFWAVHVTHHSSEEFNFTVGFRSSVLQPLYRFYYFIPITLYGFSPVDIIFMASLTQTYGILVHTQAVCKLGFLEWFLVTPSHHRVHHASNVRYLDKNLGMVFIIWDRIFGTFEAETDEEKIKYGLTKSIEPITPTKVVLHEWNAITRDIQKQIPLKEKLAYLFGPPGWSHDGSSKTSRQLREEKLLLRENFFSPQNES